MCLVLAKIIDKIEMLSFGQIFLVCWRFFFALLISMTGDIRIVSEYFKIGEWFMEIYPGSLSVASCMNFCSYSNFWLCRSITYGNTCDCILHSGKSSEMWTDNIVFYFEIIWNRLQEIQKAICDVFLADLMKIEEER